MDRLASPGSPDDRGRGRRFFRANLAAVLEWSLWFNGEIPATESGTKYESLSARCGACEVLGGVESSCMKPAARAAFAESRGRPCPYSDLAPGNVVALEVARLAMNERMTPFAVKILELRAESADEFVRLTHRVTGAIADENVQAQLKSNADG